MNEHTEPRPRLLAIGPLPNHGDPIGGAKVSFQELVNGLGAGGELEIDVLDTSRRASARGVRRALADAWGLARTLGGLFGRGRRADVWMFNASSGGVLRAGPLVWLASRLLGRPLAVRVFGGGFDLAFDRASGLWRWIVRRTALRADAVFLQTRDLVVRFGTGTRAHRLPTTRDVPFVERAPRQACRRFLYLGQLRAEKGFGALVAASHKLPEGIEIDAYGPSVPRYDAEGAAQGSRVRLGGTIASRDVPALLACYDALVLPTTWEGEGLPGAVVEALQAGLPVIATRWRSIPELVEDGVTGLAVEADAHLPARLARAMQRLAGDPELYQRLCQGARARGDELRSGPWTSRVARELTRLARTGPGPRTDATRTMHILFLSDNFPPETNAPATRLVEHARHWVAQGHRVTVVTCAPNFPEGRVHDGYANRWYSRERIGGIDVVRVKTYIAANRGFLKRTLDYVSFGVMGALAGLVQRKPDVVVGTSPQFFAALGAWFVAAVRGRPFVFELRDLWPASITAVGAMEKGRVLRMLERLELFLYRRASAIVAVTESFRRDLVRRGIDRRKIRVVTNGVDLERYVPRERDGATEQLFDVKGKFVVGYLGTHGMAHALERVLDAAEKLAHRDDIRFLFVGSGAGRAGLVADAEIRGLTNVRFFHGQPKDQVPALWGLCDVALVHLKDTPLFQTVIPSKIFEAMAMGVPTLVAAPPGEATALVRHTGAGLTVPPEDPDSLAQAVELLANDRGFAAELGRKARESASAFDRRKLADDMLVVLEHVAGLPPRPQPVAEPEGDPAAALGEVQPALPAPSPGASRSTQRAS